MEYDFLFDKARHLLAIGYNVDERRRDSSYYDLLASEARLCSFVAIAQGQLPQESWFALGRLLTTAGGEPVLISWSGSMFEYLMPLLVMPTYENTLLDQTCRAAVEQADRVWAETRGAVGHFRIRLQHGRRALNYQYRAFGVPGLGLKRGLAEDLVVAPYASALALMVAPEEACLNLQRLAAEGPKADIGFYEAIDYTPSRLPRGQSQCRGSLVHGPSPGDELPVLRLSAPRPSDAEAIRIRSVVPGDHAVAAGTDSQGHGILFAHRRSSRAMHHVQQRRRRRCASSIPRTRRYRKCNCCRTADTT